MNRLQRYWTNKAHNAINPGYNSAIQNYQAQKENFLKQLEAETGNQIDDFMEELNAAIAPEAMTELDETFDKAFESVANYVENYIVQLMEGGNPSYNALLTRFSTLVQQGESGKVNPENLYSNLAKDIEIFLASNNIDRSGLAQYVASQSGLNNTTNIDIQNNLFGYARKLIVQQLRGKELSYNIQHYKISLKGYYKEELLVPALNKLLEQYGIVAKQMGSSRNEKGQQIKYDIILGTASIQNLSDDVMAPLIQAMESMEKDINVTQTISEYTPKALGGIQSKSWIAPWSTKSYGGNRSFLSFGHNISLMPEGVNAHYWHAGVYNVMSNLTEAIGINNFIFGTGDTIYWTCDLLAKFREAQYVLAFYYNKTEGKITSGSITAQPHTDI